MSQNKYYGDTGMDSLAVGGNAPIYTFLTSVMASGKVLADDGKAYDSVQTAENNASSFVLVGPGTFSENVTIDTAGLTLVGAGYDTLIDGGTGGNAIDSQASNVQVKNLSTKTTESAGNYTLLVGGSDSIVDNIWVREGGNYGIRCESNVSAFDNIVTNCYVESLRGISVRERGIIANSTFIGPAPNSATFNFGMGCADDSVLANNYIGGAGEDGIRTEANDAIIIGNRIHNCTVNGIKTQQNSNCIIANNRVSDSGNNDLSIGGTGHITDANVTGAAN